MTEKQKYAIKLAINTMNKHFGRHYNTVYGNRETGISVGYGEAINILSDMLSNADNHTCNCQHNSNSRGDEPCCRCDSKQTNADRIRNMSDEELTEFITGLSKHCLAGIGKCDCSAYETCDNCNVEVKKWLQSEAKEIATNMENLDVRR